MSISLASLRFSWLSPVTVAVVLVLGIAAGLPFDRALANPGAPGDKVWQATFDQGDDSLRGMAVSPDGSKVFLTGYADPVGAAASDYATVAYDSLTGVELWRSLYDGPDGRSDLGWAIAASPDGSKVFVTGFSQGPNFPTDYATVAYNAASGASLWEARYAGPGGGDDEAVGIAVAPDGSRVFITGQSEGAGTYTDFATVAYDSSSGHEDWVSRYTTPCSFCADSGAALAVSPDSSTVFVTGSASPTGSSFDFYTLAYDATNGSTRWAIGQDIDQRYDNARYVVVSPDGTRVFVMGDSNGGFDSFDNVATAAYGAAAGSHLWRQRYTRMRYSWGVFPGGLAISPVGTTLYVTGSFKTESSSLHSGTVAYDAASGHRLWRSTVAGEGAEDVAVTPDGSTVIVTGSRDGGSFATVARDAATGSMLWAARDDPLGYASDLEVSPDGLRLFVAGAVSDEAGSGDYVLVAYQL